jgi:hypothetical protein
MVVKPLLQREGPTAKRYGAPLSRHLRSRSPTRSYVRDTFDLLGAIERSLAFEMVPTPWPISIGRRHAETRALAGARTTEGDWWLSTGWPVQPV